MNRKLRSTRGESIAESLVSILIVVLASIFFAGMVTASQRVIEQSTNWMTDYYAAVSAINEHRPLAGSVEQRPGEQITIKFNISGKTSNETVTAYISDKLGANIVSYFK